MKVTVHCLWNKLDGGRQVSKKVDVSVARAMVIPYNRVNCFFHNIDLMYLQFLDA